MILHRIEVENWRNWRKPKVLAPLNNGINIIHGPNEIGKSSIMDAICRGFFDRHNTAGEAMRGRQPWGSNLGPTVEIEFSHNGQRYYLKKRFIDDAMAELSVRRDGDWERISQGATADEQITELTLGDQSGRGLSKPEHWGLGQVLWAQQGSAAHLEVGDGQQAQLRGALKITLDSTQGEAIEQAVADRYGETYTSKGRLRSGQANKAEVLNLAEQLKDAQSRVEEIEQQRNELALLAHDLQAAEDENKQTLQQLQQAEKDLTAQRKDLKSLQTAQHEYEKLESAARETEATWERLNEQISRIKRAEEAVQQAQKDFQTFQNTRDKTLQSLEEAQTACNEHETRLDQRSDELIRRQEALAAAERTEQWLQIAEQLADLNKRLEKAQVLQRKVTDAQQELDQLKAPDKKELQALRKLDRDINAKQAEVDAVSLAVRLEPECDLTVKVEADGKQQSTLKQAEPIDIKALSTMALQIQGVGLITIRAGKSDAATLAKSLATLHEKWAIKTSPFGETELSKLDEMAAHRQQLEQRVEQLESHADDGEDAEELIGQIEGLEAERAALSAQDQTLEDCDQNLTAACEATKTAQQSANDAQKEHKAAENALSQVSEILNIAEKDEAKAKGKLVTAQALLTERSKEAQRLAEEDDLSSKERKRNLADALKGMDAAKLRLETKDKPPVEDLADDIDTLQAEVNRLNDDLRDQALRIGSLKQDVSRMGGQGFYSQYVEAIELQDTLERRHASANLDAEAIDLLWTTIKRHKKDVFDALVKPVRSMVSTMMHELVGPAYDCIEFDEHLRPTAIQPTGRDVQASIDDLSFGTQEQIMLLIRLALARLLGVKDNRQCVILDDPLVNTDRRRQRAALRTLQQAAQYTQILIFTCHPIAYEMANETSVFDLS
jgi:chromosome segregation ATPase